VINKFENRGCVEGMKEYPDNYFHLAVVDPPYNIVSQQKRGIGSRIDVSGKMNDWNNKKPEPEYYTQLFRVSKFQIIWGANNFILPETEYFIVWDKQQTVDNFASAEYAWTNVKKPAQIFHYSIHKCIAERKSHGGKIHPTQKPVALYLWLLNNYAKQGDLILDTHVGSASSLIACEKLGFNYVGYELDVDYYKAACGRLNEFRQQIDMFIDKPAPIIEQERLNL